MEMKMLLPLHEQTKMPVTMSVLVRPSRKQQSRLRCHMLIADPKGGEKPVQVEDLRLEMN